MSSRSVIQRVLIGKGNTDLWWTCQSPGFRLLGLLEAYC